MSLLISMDLIEEFKVISVGSCCAVTAGLHHPWFLGGEPSILGISPVIGMSLVPMWGP